MRVRVLILALCLMTFGLNAVPGVDAAPEPVGGCESGATVEVCSVHCINPPCEQYVCVTKGERICTND